jgi:hypothetical protein
LLVDGIANILDGDAVIISGRHLKTQRPPKVDPADWWVTYELLEILLVFDGAG